MCSAHLDRHRTRGISDSLDHFLAALLPSGASCEDVAWICIDRVSTNPTNGSDGGPQGNDDGHSVSPSAAAVENLLGDWESLLASEPRPSHADIDALALKYGVLRFESCPQVAVILCCCTNTDI